MTSSRSDYLPKASPHNTITLGVRASTREIGGADNRAFVFLPNGDTLSPLFIRMTKFYISYLIPDTTTS